MNTNNKKDQAKYIAKNLISRLTYHNDPPINKI